MSKNISVQLYYVYDPVCRWCFGFHPVIEKIEKRFQDTLNITAIPGGLAIDEHAGAIRDHYPHMMQETETVQKITGRKFGEPFRLLMEEGSYPINSLPASMAQIIINEHEPEKSVEFAGRLQKKLFTEGENINNTETCLDIMKGYSMPSSQFLKLMGTRETEKKTRNNFEWCRKNGAGVFPSLLLNIGEEYGLMAKGYRPYETIESHLHHLIRNAGRLSGSGK